MIDGSTLDRYFDPERPWVRGLFDEDIVGLRVKLDDAGSRKLAMLTGWEPRDKKGHRYHNTLVMMNIHFQQEAFYQIRYDLFSRSPQQVGGGFLSQSGRWGGRYPARLGRL